MRGCKVWTLWTLWTCVSNRSTPFAYFLSRWVFLLMISTIHNIHKAPRPYVWRGLQRGSSPHFFAIHRASTTSTNPKTAPPGEDPTIYSGIIVGVDKRKENLYARVSLAGMTNHCLTKRSIHNVHNLPPHRLCIHTAQHKRDRRKDCRSLVEQGYDQDHRNWSGEYVLRRSVCKPVLLQKLPTLTKGV